MTAVVAGLGSVRTGAEIDGALRAMMRVGMETAGSMGLKTFVADLEHGRALTSRRPYMGWTETPTGVAGVSTLVPRYVGELQPGSRAYRKLVPDCELYLDRRMGRFCLVHTLAPDRVAAYAMALLIYTTQVNRAWIGPRALNECVNEWRSDVNGLNGTARASRQETRMVAGRTVLGTVRARGAGADGSGHVEIDADCDGWIAARDGTCVEAHLRLAGMVRERYARMATRVEECSTGCLMGPDLTDIGGGVTILLSKKIEDVQRFVDIVFGNPRFPRMLERHLRQGDTCHYVPTFDGGSGTYLSTAISTKYEDSPALLITLKKRNPGSATLWLLSRIQMHYDAGATCIDLTTGGCGG